MKWALAAVGVCYAGMVLIVVGLLVADVPTAQAGRWMTVPFTVVLGAPVALLLVIAPAAGLLRLAERLRGRRAR